MSIADDDIVDGAGGAKGLLTRAAAADARADVRLAQAIDDFFLPDDARLDDRARAALATTIAKLLAAVERTLRRHAGKLLTARDAAALADRLRDDDASVLDRLASAGLLRDTDLMRELLGRVRAELLSEALPVRAPDQPDQPSLLAHLTQSPDEVVAIAARALLAAESRRLTKAGELPAADDLPAELHQRLVWWVAAALRERFAGESTDTLAALDRALAEAALRAIAAHDADDRLEVAAVRLAAAIDAGAGEIDALLVESLADRRLSLFVALVAHALGIDYEAARDLSLDPAGAQLWPVLRALGLERPTIARIGLSLSEADQRRDLDGFAGALDAIMAVTPGDARAALAPLLLHPDYRAALRGLSRAA